MCKHGDTIRLPVISLDVLTGRGKWAYRKIDRCLAPLVQALNVAGIYTSNSCCGHGKGSGGIYLHDGRYLEITWTRLSGEGNVI